MELQFPTGTGCRGYPGSPRCALTVVMVVVKLGVVVDVVEVVELAVAVVVQIVVMAW